jgi:hypothetical protein
MARRRIVHRRQIQSLGSLPPFLAVLRGVLQPARLAEQQAETHLDLRANGVTHLTGERHGYDID